MTIRSVSAITLAVRDMNRSVGFYRKLGFELVYGGESSGFSTLKAGGVVLNLISAGGREILWWGRVIFRVESVDAEYRRLKAQGLEPDEPRDASWGERYFHLVDPDGHELSFAELLP